MIHKERMTAHIEGDFVLFLIGMRFNQPWKVHKWLPVVSSMGRMLRELQSKPELGLLHQDIWVSRTIMQVQYWRSMDHLLDYAKNRDSQHLPAWRAFNKAINNNGSVGIWHETYAVSEGSYENIYANMPPFGMGLAGTLEPVRGKHETAAGRLGK
jgi:hypothetical protein